MLPFVCRALGASSAIEHVVRELGAHKGTAPRRRLHGHTWRVGGVAQSEVSEQSGLELHCDFELSAPLLPLVTASTATGDSTP